MKTTFTSHEIAHIWAHKSAPYGKAPANMHFSGRNGESFYSYNTVIARHIEHKGKPAILLNVTHYSPSTSNHQGYVRGAIDGLGLPIFRVDGQDFGASLSFTGDELFTHYVEQAALAMKDSEQPRIRPHTREAHKGRAASFLEQAQAVAAFFGLRKKVDEKAISRLAIAKARAEKRAAAEQAKRDAAERERQQAAFKAWIDGLAMPDGESSWFNARLFPVAFRVEIRNGEQELVSTLGARVPLRAAQVAYRFAMSKRGQDWRENGETCPVGHYRLNAINEHGIIAGCHRITWAELERLAPVLSGETVNA